MLFDNLPTKAPPPKSRAPYTRRPRPVQQLSLLAHGVQPKAKPARPKLAKAAFKPVTPKGPADQVAKADRRAAFQAVLLDLPNPHPRLSDAWYKRRIERGWRVAKFRGLIMDFADVEEIAHSTARKFLLTHAPDLHRALLDGVLPGSLTAAQRLERLERVQAMIEDGHTMTTIAGALDMLPVSLAAFLREWAPDGILSAIDDERDAIEADAEDLEGVAA